MGNVQSTLQTNLQLYEIAQALIDCADVKDEEFFKCKLEQIKEAPSTDAYNRNVDPNTIWRFTDIPRALLLSRCTIKGIAMGDCYAENAQLQRELRSLGHTCDLYDGPFYEPVLKEWGHHCFCVQYIEVERNGEKFQRRYYYDRSNGEEQRVPLVNHLDKCKYDWKRMRVNGVPIKEE